MLLYKEIFNIRYTLRTFDIDFALETITPVSGNFVDLEKLFIDLGYIVVTDYQSGLRKFTRKGLEVEFLVHRKGGRDAGSEGNSLVPYFPEEIVCNLEAPPVKS